MSHFQNAKGHLRVLYPGVAAAAVIGLAAQFLGDHYGAPVMLFALLIGMAFNFLADQGPCAPGIGFASKTLLRAGVALLGLRVTFADIETLGWASAGVILGLMSLTIATGFIAARAFGRGWRFALLTGGAVAICGASAALALAAVIPANDKMERNTLFTVASVTILSTVAMIFYPILFNTLGFDDRVSGFLIGATIHDVAQVVGAGYTISPEAGDLGTLVKLFRVIMLPVVLTVVIVALLLARSSGSQGRPSIPAFVIVFAVLAMINSTGMIPPAVTEFAGTVSRALLVTAIAALGVKTALSAMTNVGGGHAAVVTIETLVLLGATVALAYSGLLPI